MRSTTISLLSTAALVLLCMGSSAAQMRAPAVPQEAHDEAQRSLPMLRQMVTPETYLRLGFRSVEEAQQANLGSPLRIFIVRLDRLREYKAGANAHELLEDTHEVRYPVLVEGQARTSLVMHEIDGKWQVAKFGRPLLTQALTEQVRKRNEQARGPESSFFEVRIPAMNLDFVARQEHSRLTLTSTVGNPKFEVKQGEEFDAPQLFARLASYAKEVKTGPFLSD